MMSRRGEASQRAMQPWMTSGRAGSWFGAFWMGESSSGGATAGGAAGRRAALGRGGEPSRKRCRTVGSSSMALLSVSMLGWRVLGEEGEREASEDALLDERST